MRGRQPGYYRLGSAVVFTVTVLCVGGVIGLLARPKADPGTRVWLLNHTPDQVVIINPFDGVAERAFQVADGLRELAFSRDYTRAYVANVVDVSNRLTVLDAKTYLDDEIIEVDGVPQGIGVFPDNHKLAVILGSKTDFMAGGFDVIDLQRRSEADPKRKLRLYRERGLRLTSKIAVSDDGDRIYCVDAKAPVLSVFSLSARRKVGEVDLHGAPTELLYPYAGSYYYVSVLAHQAIYQLDKRSDQVVGAFIYQLRDPTKTFSFGRLRYMAMDREAKYLFATNYEGRSVAVWEIGNPEYALAWQQVPVDPRDERSYRWPVTHYLPKVRFKLKGGYDPNITFVPGGLQLGVDPRGEYLFVMDDEGGFYIYDLPDVMRAKDLSTPKPRHVVVLGHDIEVRDLQVSVPGQRATTPGGGG